MPALECTRCGATAAAGSAETDLWVTGGDLGDDWLCEACDDAEYEAWVDTHPRLVAVFAEQHQLERELKELEAADAVRANIATWQSGYFDAP